MRLQRLGAGPKFLQFHQRSGSFHPSAQVSNLVVPRREGSTLPLGLGLPTLALPHRDFTAGGLLAQLSRRQGRGIEAGALIAFRYPNLAAWHAGIVRRVQRQDPETRHVGIEKLTAEISGVILAPRFRRQADGRPNTIVGMFLIDASAAADEMTLLLPAGTFSPSVPLELRVGSRDDLLIPQELIESAHDYQIARYKRLAQPGSQR